MKCIKCNKFGFASKGCTLSDGWICLDCFKALGFNEDHKGFYTYTSYNDIADGYDKYMERLYANDQQKDDTPTITIKFAHYGEERELNATDEEKQMFDILADMVSPQKLRFVRVSNNYVTAKLGEWDLARFKYTDRTHWILFPVKEMQKERHLIEDPKDIRGYSDIIQKSLEHIEKYTI